ncbi:MAG: EamA family transporter RarD [Luteolibacter sp.]
MSRKSHTGVLTACVAFFSWGVLPIFWKHLDFLPPVQIVAHRTLWSLLVLLPVIILLGEWRSWLSALRSPKSIGWLLLSGLLICGNWLLYIWATLNGHIIEGALGYYLNPFFNMLFGALWFGERHNRPQQIAIALALGGVAIQVIAVGHLPVIALALALTFSLYAVIRKFTPYPALAGLTAETTLLAPFALGWLLWTAPNVPTAFGNSLPNAWLIASTGLVTALPLFCFGYAAKTIRLTTLGILQFIGPTLQFLIGWQLYGEAMTPGRLASFALIWLAIGLYATDALRKNS